MATPIDTRASAPKRALAAIMFSDIAGYTAIMGRDEQEGLAAREAHRQLLRTILPGFNGRLLGDLGDGALSSFHSAIDAVNCARAFQAASASNPQVRIRVGIHVGDVLFSDDTVLGDGVNIASRIVALAPPGGICISERVYEEIRNQRGMAVRNIGQKSLKNVDRPIGVYVMSDAADSRVTSESPILKSSRVTRIAIALAGVLALAAVVYVATRSRFAPGSAQQPAMPHQIRSIAVLPLDNYSGDPNQEYFADGMTDELTTDLAKISALRVISRGSVMRFKGANRPPTPEIAKMLNVDAVVEGSVLRSGERVRITAQLIDAPADKHLWADTFERGSRDVLALEDELASAIAKEIEVHLTPKEQAQLTTSVIVNPAAHEAYLRGRYYLNGWTPDKLNKAIGQFKRAIALDPNFALPYAGLADAYGDADDVYISPSAMPEAKAAAEKALQLDESLAEAHASLGYVQFLYDYDMAAAESQYRRAIELSPNVAAAHFYYGFLLSVEGRFDEAIAEGRKASELDPLSSSVAVISAYPFMFQGKYDTARAMVQQGIDLAPTSDIAQYLLGLVDLESGNFGRAIVELEKARRPEAIPYVDGWLGYTYAASGDRASALAKIKELDAASSHRYVSPFTTAIIYLALGDKERALSGLERAYDVHSQWLFLLKVDKIFDPLRSEPRFVTLLKKVNLDK